LARTEPSSNSSITRSIKLTASRSVAVSNANFAFDAVTLRDAVSLMERVIGELENSSERAKPSPRKPGKKVALTRKRRVTGKKATSPRRKKVIAKKVVSAKRQNRRAQK
jgi:hypothetical protein